MKSGTPVSEARSWVPIIAALAAIFISASVYDLHRRHEIFAFIGVLISLVTMVVIWSTMAAIRTLDVVAMMGVYLLWLIRGTMIRPQSNSELSIVSSELLGGSISLLLVIAALLTFLDRRILIKPAQLALIAIYGLLLMVPHACSMSYGLSQTQIYLRTVMFALVWLGEDYVYSRDPALGKDRSFDARWWLSHLFSVEYVLTMIRSVWILFVHEFLMLFLLLFGLMWLINIKIIKLPAPPEPSSSSSRKANKSYDSGDDDSDDIELGHRRGRRSSPVPSPHPAPPRRRHVVVPPPTTSAYDEEQALVPVVNSNAAMADLVRMTARMIFEELQRVNNQSAPPQLQSSITILNTSAQQRSPLSSPIALSAAAAAAAAAPAPPVAATSMVTSPPVAPTKSPPSTSSSPTPQVARINPSPIPTSSIINKPVAVAPVPSFKLPAKPAAALPKPVAAPPKPAAPPQSKPTAAKLSSINLPSSLFSKKP